MKLSKRDLMRLSGTTIVAGLAGCQTTTGGGDDEREPTDRDTSEDRTSTVVADQEAEIKFVDTSAVTTLPIVRPDTIDDVASVELQISDPDGLQDVVVAYSDDYRDEPVLLSDEMGTEEDTEVGNQTVQITRGLPQRVLAPRTGEFTVEVTDTNGNTRTRTRPIDDLEGSYRADRKRRADSNAETHDIGSYKTGRHWDDLTTNTREIQEMQQEWLNQEMYTPLVNQVMSGENFEAGGRSFPNSNYEENDPGYFDQEAVQEEDDFETLVRWYLPAIMHHDRENYGNAPSGRNQRFAATLETLINEHHPEAETQATHVKSLPGHGIFGVQDTVNEEFYLVDTTASSPQYDEAVGRISDFITSEDGDRSELWDPYHSFEPGPQEGLHYEGKSESAMAGLFNFVENTGSNEQLDYDSFFITDQWMDDAYQLLRNGGSIDPIVEPIEEMIYQSLETDTDSKIGIYGNLDDTRMAVDSTGEIYEAVKLDETQTPGIDNIETLLETATAR